MIDPNSPVTAEEVGRVFRKLADEHVDAVNNWADNEALWNRMAHGRTTLTAVPDQPHAGSPVRRLFGTSGSRSRRVGILMAALTGLSAAAFALNWQHEVSEAPMSFVVDGGTPRSTDDDTAQVIASDNEPVHVELSDDSEIDLHPHTTLQLSSITPKDSTPTAGSTVASATKPEVVARVSQGKINVRVEHHESNRYRFHAGPYIVRVVGSAFSLNYRPEGEQLQLDGVEGTVEVTSPRGMQKVRAGQSLRLSAVDVSTGQASKVPATGELEAATTSDAKSSDGAIRNTPESKPHKSARASGNDLTDFSKLTARGEFSTVVSLARKQGVHQVLSTYPAGQLQDLAQAARYTGRMDLAEQTWTAMQKRFSGTSAANAGFFLGRLAQQRGQLSTALRHFETYLRASPGGVYAPEAWGRKLQVIQSTRGSEAARDVAREYVRRYPQGAYAQTAREILSSN